MAETLPAFSVSERCVNAHAPTTTTFRRL